MTSLSGDFLLRDEYVDHQNRQNEFLNQELPTIHQSIDQIESKFESRLKEFKDDINRRFNSVDHRFDDFTRLFNELKAESLRNTAYMRNNGLCNPKWPIRPLSAIHSRDIIDPDPALFPRHADDFYALRDPSTSQQRRMLVYLASFYDIPHAHAASDSDDDQDSIVIQNPQDTVDMLEAVLGLREDNFNEFRQRALELASRSPLRQSSDPNYDPLKKFSTFADLSSTQTQHQLPTSQEKPGLRI